MSRRIEVNRRDDSDFELTFTDVDGEAIDLTNCTVFFTAKRKRDDTDDEAIIKKQITSFSDPQSGIATLQLTKSETDISPRSYYFDIQLKQSNGKISSIQAGRLIVRQDITVRTS